MALARFKRLILGSGLTGTDNGDGTITVATTEPDNAAHVADTSDAHDAVAISVADAGGYYSGADVEAVLQEAGASIAGMSPAGDTEVWMPLTTVVAGAPELVWDADDSLIPTLTPL